MKQVAKHMPMKHISACLMILLACLTGAVQVMAQELETGYASFYADRFHGKKTASGESYNKNLFTAAHRSLPFGTMVKVTRVDNQKSVVVRVNDRGPFVKGRVIDLSRAAARQLGMLQPGTTMVKLEILKKGMKQEVVAYEPEPENTRIPESPSSLSQRGLGLFHLDAFRAHDRGFGIQLAAYQEFRNILEATSELQRKNQRKTMVHVTRSSNGTVFRLIVGPFDTRKEAEVYQRRFSSLLEKGIVVDLSRLK